MDKLNFEDLPSEKTPINAPNLNGMQNKIEKSVVAISSTKPNTSENIWFQKSDNLFNIDMPYQVTGDTNSYTLKLNPNTRYTMSSNVPSSSPASLYFGGGSTVANGVSSGNSKTMTTDSQGNIRVEVRTEPASSGGYNLFQGVKDGTYWIMLNQGETAKKYEPYIKKTIMTKNSNGVFEEFIKEDIAEIIESGKNLAVKFSNGIMIQVGSKYYSQIKANATFYAYHQYICKVDFPVKFKKIYFATPVVTNITTFALGMESPAKSETGASFIIYTPRSIGRNNRYNIRLCCNRYLEIKNKIKEK